MLNVNDIIIEILRALLVGGAFIGLLYGRRSKTISGVPGWWLLISGAALVFFGTLIDITDNFEELNTLIIIGNTPSQAFLEKVVGYLVGFLLIALGIWRWLPKVIEHEEATRKALDEAEKELKILSGLLPICASCKKICDDNGDWKQIEVYVSQHSEAQFTHGLCDDCAEELYPGMLKKTPE